MNLDPVQTAIFLVALTVWVFAVVVPALRLSRAWLPHESEWESVRADIRELTRDDVPNESYHETTKQALQLVLTGVPGFGRLGQVPLALDVIVAPTDSMSRTLRSLSAQSIVLGLAGTVVTFATLFGTQEFEPGPDAKNAVASVLQHLSVIYILNSVAIVTSFSLYHWAWVTKRRGEDAATAAGRAFAELQEGGAFAIAPELASALERTAREFREFAEILFNGQFSKIEMLLGQVAGLGSGIQALVRETVAQNGRDQGILQAQLREHSTSLERITERLDSGFKLLAQPFIQGIPAMQALDEAAQGLKRATDALSVAQLPAVAEQLRTSTRALSHQVEEAPKHFKRVLDDTGAAIANATKNGLSDGLQEVVARRREDQERALSSLTAQLIAAAGELRATSDHQSGIRGAALIDALGRYVARIETPLVNLPNHLDRTTNAQTSAIDALSNDVIRAIDRATEVARASRDQTAAISLAPPLPEPGAAPVGASDSAEVV